MVWVFITENRNNSRSNIFIPWTVQQSDSVRGIRRKFQWNFLQELNFVKFFYYLTWGLYRNLKVRLNRYQSFEFAKIAVQGISLYLKENSFFLIIWGCSHVSNTFKGKKKWKMRFVFYFNIYLLIIIFYTIFYKIMGIKKKLVVI